MRINAFCVLILFSSGLFVRCGVNQSDYNKLKFDYELVVSENDSIKQRINELENENDKKLTIINKLRDSISILSFPADQRLVRIIELIDKQDYFTAKKEIADLKKVFPESKEAKQVSESLKKINELEEKKKRDEERMLALGFKALKPSLSCKIDYNKVEISSLSIGNSFIFDSYDDRYYYRSADRGNKYITAVMKITSESMNPQLPQPAFYIIEGDKMKFDGWFSVEFARWEDYGTYLGNDHDFGNDFAKTSTIRFKIGKEVSEENLKKPYAIILKKENFLSREYNRFDTPPISYNGFVDYPYHLKLNDFTSENSKYVVIKIANL